jgi:hypothetical protein
MSINPFGFNNAITINGKVLQRVSKPGSTSTSTTTDPFDGHLAEFILFDLPTDTPTETIEEEGEEPQEVPVPIHMPVAGGERRVTGVIERSGDDLDYHTGDIEFEIGTSNTVEFDVAEEGHTKIKLPAAEHNLLSETHSDTTAATPPDSGDIIIGSDGTWTVLSYQEDGKILGAVGGLPAWVAASGATLSTQYPLAVGASAVTGDGEESLPWNHVHAGVTSIGLADADPADPKQGVITLSEGSDIEITESNNAFIFANTSTLQTVCVRGATTETTITTSNTDGFIINGYHTHDEDDAGHQYSLGYENDGGLTDLVLNITDNAEEPATTELRRYDQSAGKWIFAKPVDVDGNITALDGFAVRMQNDDETYSVGLKASDSLAADLDFVMPTADGTNGQAIVTDANKNLSFASVKPTAGTNISVSGTQVSLDLTGVTGYDDDEVQILGHDDSGALKWYDVCSEA